MRPHCDRDDQIELFTDFAPAAERAPKLGLPIQKSNTIDVRRAAAILHVSHRTTHRMCERGILRSYLMNHLWQIDYSSVVEYCDQLRVRHAISDARVGLKPRQKRRRDEDLLPFPWSETIFVRDVQERLDCSDQSVLHLIESGDLPAYQISTNKAGSVWRIHAPSLEAYLAKLHRMVSRAAIAPPAANTPPAK